MPSKKLLWLVPFCLLAACGNANNEKGYGNTSEQRTDAAAAEAQPSADPDTKPGAYNAPDRLVVRKADIQCEVTDVLTAVTRLERQVRAMEGIIEDSHVYNNANETRQIDYKPDSVKVVHIYSTAASLTLRVPAAMLDSLISTIPANATLIESRRIGQEDVTLKYLSNVLLNEPADKESKIARALKQARDGQEVAALQQYADEQNEKIVGRHIENLQLEDRVAFATLTVGFTQPGQVLVQVVANADYITRVPFFIQFKGALSSGLQVLSDLFIGLLRIWPLILLAIAGIYGYRSVRQKRQEAMVLEK